MYIRLLSGTSDNRALLRYMEESIVAQLEDPLYYYPTSDAEWDSHFSDQGAVVIATIDSQPAGYVIGSFATRAGGYLLRTATEVTRVSAVDVEELFWLDGVGVMPDFRGRGLQKKMSVFFEQKARSMGARGILATVAHKNIYSLRNFLDRGYEVVMESDLDGHKPRLVVLGDVSRLAGFS